MKQLTAKTVEDVLGWIESTPHHKGKVEAKFFVLEGHHDRLRIPRALCADAAPLYHASPDQHDTRMYRATPAGKARLTRWRKRVEADS
jgi:hypothetical protein